MFERVALIGLGLIGSSLSHAMRRGGLARTIVGHAQSEKTRDTALRLGLVGSVYASAAEAARDADLVILCVPVGACGTVAREMAPAMRAGAILTDVGSVKGAVLRDVGPFVPEGVHFIPGHPIAGTEHSGPESGFAELFDGRWCILTPPEGADASAVARLSAFWQACGSHVEIMDAAAPRPGARHHQPRAAPHRLQHRQHGAAPGAGHRHGGDQVLGRRLSRLHAHRRLRPGHVARRVPQQQGGGAGDARPLQRGPHRPAARHPLRRRRHALQAVRGGARGPARHHRGRPGYGGARLRPPARHAPKQP